MEKSCQVLRNNMIADLLSTLAKECPAPLKSSIILDTNLQLNIRQNTNQAL